MSVFVVVLVVVLFDDDVDDDEVVALVALVALVELVVLPGDRDASLPMLIKSAASVVLGLKDGDSRSRRIRSCSFSPSSSSSGSSEVVPKLVPEVVPEVVLVSDTPSEENDERSRKIPRV